MTRFSIIVLLLFILNPHELLAQCDVHQNFKDIIKHIEGEVNYGPPIYELEVTVVSPGRSSGSHRYTAWAIGGEIGNHPRICQDGLSLQKRDIYFSDRNHFDKNSADLESFKFDIVRNSVEVTLHTWSDGKQTISNLVRSGNLIYGFSDDGAMIIFSFFKTYGLG